MQIGQIGGNGPAATGFLSEFHVDASTLMKNLMRENKDAQAEIDEGLTQRPKQAGTDCIAIPSIADHLCIKNFKVKSCLPS